MRSLAALAALAALGCGPSEPRRAPRSAGDVAAAAAPARRLVGVRVSGPVSAPTTEVGPLAPERYCTSRWSITDLIPSHDYGTLDGRVVAVLFRRGLLGAEEPGAEGRREYLAGIDGRSPYALYFESLGEGENFMHGWRVDLPTPGRQASFDGVAMFTPETPNRFGLGRGVHLVELEVNRGQGGRGIHFVATDVRVLDGAAGFMPDPTGLLVRAHARLGTVRRTLGLTFPAHPDLPEPRARRYLSWSQVDEALTIVLVDRRGIGASTLVMQDVTDPLDCVGDAPAPVRTGPLLRWGMRFDVSRAGDFLTETVYLPH